MTDKNNNPLNNYQWTGVNHRNEKIRGVTQASHLILAKNSLGSQGVAVKKIRKQRKRFSDYLKQKISQGDIALFSRQMATLVGAGVPLVQSCAIISASHRHQQLRQLINQIKHDIETGKTFAQSLQKYPNLFNDLFCNLVDAGEKSGCLDIMLEELATYNEKIEILKKNIKKAVSYPLFVLIVSFLITGALLIFVVPQFQTLFIGFDAQLPAMTRAIIHLSQIFQHHWATLLILGASSLYLVMNTKIASPKLANTIERGLLSLPVLGAIIKNSAIARFTRTLAITFAAGLPLVDALKSVAGATGNPLFIEATDKIREHVAAGQSLQLAIKNTQLFPNRVIQMVAIGEESGKLEHLLSKTADFYEQEVDLALEVLSSLLEPIIMLILGILVGGLVIALYLPLFKLGSLV